MSSFRAYRERPVGGIIEGPPKRLPPNGLGALAGWNRPPAPPAPLFENCPTIKKKLFWTFAGIFAVGIVCWPLFR
jgi:hypothetical protein